MNTVFFDVDTQIDFLYPAGALYVPGAEEIVETVGALNRFAGAHGIPLISDIDAHTENDLEFLDWPPHCVAGTWGQRKPANTLLESRLVLSSRAPLDFWPAGVSQLMLEKQSLDAFSNPRLPGFLQRLGAERFVVYGVVTEICVQRVAWGLIAMGKRVELVTDAVMHLNQQEARRTFEEFQRAGGTLTTSVHITGASTRLA